MAIVRMTAEEARARGRVDRAKVEATSDEDIDRHMKEDGFNPKKPFEGLREMFPATVVRKRTGLSQDAFAKAIGVPAATLRNWEQGRTPPDPAARALLTLVASDPDWTLATLSGDRRGHKVQVVVSATKRGTTTAKVFDTPEAAQRHADTLVEPTLAIVEADYVRAPAQQSDRMRPKQ